MIRPAVILRKNSYANGSDDGADLQAVLMSIYRTLKLRGHNPILTMVGAIRSYLKTVLRGFPGSVGTGRSSHLGAGPEAPVPAPRPPPPSLFPVAFGKRETRAATVTWDSQCHWSGRERPRNSPMSPKNRDLAAITQESH